MSDISEMEVSLALCRAKMKERQPEAKEGVVVDVDLDEFVTGDDGEELLIYQDAVDAMNILRKCMHLMDYVGDADVCSKVTKRERQTMTVLSEEIREFLDSTAEHYEVVE